ncbi:MFS transporter [Nocardia sp. NBC_00565]|uniref:MFS transporter n=1 Tax=Nocardia sp. NBC_00565 TaxID=2975993 RepID=UPI002E7FE348|nr:MFS transporter [Nocardia sp. NBC_00565]WUC03784.1 MFS transporter [Nocardia sp. NBC_00565]
MANSAAGTVLRDPNARRFFAGHFTSLLGDGMVGMALAFAVLDLTGSPTDLGTVLSARTIALLAAMLAGGVVADRFSRRRVMLTADVVRILTQSGMAVLLLSGHARIWELATMQVVYGAATAMFTPAVTGLLPQIAGERLQQANALRGQAISLAYLVGPAVAGVMITATNPGWVFVLDALSFAISAYQLARLRVVGIAEPRRSQSMLRDLAEGWAEFRVRGWLWAYLSIVSLNNMLFAVFIVLGPAVVGRAGTGPAQWSALAVAIGIGALLGGTVAAKIAPRYPARIASRMQMLIPLPVIGLAAHLPIPVLMALCLFAGAGTTVSNVMWGTLQQRHIDAAVLSRVNSFTELGSLAAQPIGQAGAGPVAAAIGIPATLWSAGLIQFGVAFLGLTLPQTRNLPAEPAGSATAADR